MAKREKKYREPFNAKKEARLIPAYILVGIWVLFIIAALV